MPDLLEKYHAARQDFERLFPVIREMDAAPHDKLRDIGWVADQIREVGLFPVHEFAGLYREESPYVNASSCGLIQNPVEYAEYLVVLSHLGIRNYLEIGTFTGSAACLTAAYLRRFHPDFRLTTIDLNPLFHFYPLFRDILPIDYQPCRTSFDFKDQNFDAVFIDADHCLEWAWADYENCGRRARVCAFHDIHNTPYMEMLLGGCPAAWALVRQEEAHPPGTVFHDISDPRNNQFFGIGVVVRPASN